VIVTVSASIASYIQASSIGLVYRRNYDFTATTGQPRPVKDFGHDLRSRR
jgi:hypothetical protein